MKYRIDVRVVGYETVVVEADSQDEADEEAVARVMEYQVSDLRWKETACTNLDEPEELT